MSESAGIDSILRGQSMPRPYSTDLRTRVIEVRPRPVPPYLLAVMRNPNAALALRSFRAGEAFPPVWYQSHRGQQRSPFSVSVLGIRGQAITGICAICKR